MVNLTLCASCEDCVGHSVLRWQLAYFDAATVAVRAPHQESVGKRSGLLAAAFLAAETQVLVHLHEDRASFNL